MAERPGNTETKKNCLVLAGIYLFKANNGNTETMCEICSKLTIKTTKTLFWRLNLWLLEILHYKELCNLINRKGGADQNDKNNCITWCFLKCLCQYYKCITSWNIVFKRILPFAWSKGLSIILQKQEFSHT